MDLGVETANDVTVVVLGVAELDASNAPELKRDIAPILASSARVVIDLGRVRFVDSSGLGAFLSCLRKVHERGGELKLCALSDAVRAVFELVRMDRIFDLQPTREAAIRAFAAA